MGWFDNAGVDSASVSSPLEASKHNLMDDRVGQWMVHLAVGMAGRSGALGSVCVACGGGVWARAAAAWGGQISAARVAAARSGVGRRGPVGTTVPTWPNTVCAAKHGACMQAAGGAVDAPRVGPAPVGPSQRQRDALVGEGGACGLRAATVSNGALISRRTRSRQVPAATVGATVTSG
jgi:hypothetical protein